MTPLPQITITAADRQRLISLATNALPDARDGIAASMLLSEIARANVVPPASLPPTVVRMGCEIEIRDNIKGSAHRLRLVFPGEDDSGEQKISVLTPLGAALIGLSQGDSIDWCTATGDQSNVTVLKVLTCGTL